MTNQDLPERPQDLRTRELTPRGTKLLREYGYDCSNQPTSWDKDYPTKSMYSGMDSRRRSGLAYTYDGKSLTDLHAYDVSGRRTNATVGGATNIYAYADGNPVSEEDPSGKCPWCIGMAIGAVAGAIGGYEAGGWKGAAAGALAGGITGVVAPWAAEAAGFGAGPGLAGAAAVVGSGAASGAIGTIAANAATGQPLSKGIAFGATVGALAPLISGEAFVVGATGVEGTAPYWLSGASGAVGAFGGALDPEAENGIKPVVPLSVTSQSCHR